MQKSTVSTASKTSKAGVVDAISILTEDHAKVKKLFKQYESVKESGSAEDKQAIAAEICAELTVHATAEEEIFYPAVRAAIDDDELLNEADVEHASAKELIAQISESSPEDEMYDAKVKVLSEYIDHHVKEEEGEMFPKVRKAKVDLASLGAEIEARKDELLAEMAGETVEDSAPKSRGRAKR
jgi:hemerythrin superfamily protein